MGLLNHIEYIFKYWEDTDGGGQAPDIQNLMARIDHFAS